MFEQQIEPAEFGARRGIRYCYGNLHQSPGYGSGVIPESDLGLGLNCDCGDNTNADNGGHKDRPEGGQLPYSFHVLPRSATPVARPTPLASESQGTDTGTDLSRAGDYLSSCSGLQLVTPAYPAVNGHRRHTVHPACIAIPLLTVRYDLS